MGCFQTKCTCDGSVGMENITIARECLKSERTALKEGKLNMEQERERLKWKFDAEVAILGKRQRYTSSNAENLKREW